jgi:tetraacyldisaccharide 4'-kinase
MNSLSPLGWLYGLATDARNRLYDREIIKSYPLGAPAISIGNITTGGTGKTPLVAMVARLLADKGERVCILTRGYGRKSPSQRVLVSDGRSVLADARIGGDEPVELASKLIGKAAVLADRDRVAAAEWAIEELRTNVFVLDDAFQHRRARRDLDLVCIDSTNPFGNDELLPAGTLREKTANLRRADAIVLTRTDLVKDVDAIEEKLRRIAPAAAIFRSSNKITRIVALAQVTTAGVSTSRAQNEVLSEPVFGFCGLGNPSNFFRQLEKEGLQLAGRKTFPDHHFYTDSDIREIEKKARAAGADSLITTVKDAVRLVPVMPSMPCYVAEIETVMADPAAFHAMIFSLEALAYHPNKRRERPEYTRAGIVEAERRKTG